MKLGTLRYIYVRTFDTISAGDSESARTIVLDGDKYAYAIDGILIDIETISNEYKFTVDFSIIDTLGVETRILQNLPYSLRGTIYGSHYIPVKKDTNYPVLPVRGEIYYKLSNNDTSDVTGVAFAVMGYPIVERD